MAKRRYRWMPAAEMPTPGDVRGNAIPPRARGVAEGAPPADPTAAQSQPTASEDRTRARRRDAAVRSSAPERADGPRTRAGSAWVCELRQIVPRNGLGRRKSSPLCDGRRAAANQALRALSVNIYD